MEGFGIIALKSIAVYVFIVAAIRLCEFAASFKKKTERASCS
jgi:hypothetical protein